MPPPEPRLAPPALGERPPDEDEDEDPASSVDGPEPAPAPELELEAAAPDADPDPLTDASSPALKVRVMTVLAERHDVHTAP